MTANTATESDETIESSVQSDLTKDLAEKLERGLKFAPMPTAENPFEPVSRLPRRIAGGFKGIGDDLDRRAREWRNTVRLMEQQRPQLESAEAERDRLYTALERIVPQVQESSKSFKTMIGTAKSGDVSGDIAAQFNKNLKALDELESIAEALTANMLGLRSCWEQYAKTIIRAQKMRDELKHAAEE